MIYICFEMMRDEKKIILKKEVETVLYLKCAMSF